MRASGYARAVNDWYREPDWCVKALLEAEKPKGILWDPACGGGNIPQVCTEAGLICHGSDIVQRDGASGFFVVRDFLSPATDMKVDTILSNPPFGVIEAWIKKSLEQTTDRVILLARLALLEGQKRSAFLKTTPLARVYVSSKRISMPPGGRNIKPTNGAIAYAFFVWEHGYDGEPVVRWI